MPKKLEHEQLDAVEDVLGKTPILNRLELDKLIKFIKLLYLRPVLGVVFLIQMGFVAQYVFGDSRTETVYMIALFSVLFVVVLIILSTLELKLQSYKSLLEIIEDEHKLISSVSLSQEGLRNNWVIGWIEMMKIQHQQLNDLSGRILYLEAMDDKTKIITLKEIKEGEYAVIDEYKQLFPHLTNSMEEFQIGMKIPPPHPDSTNLEWINETIERLRKKVDL